MNGYWPWWAGAVGLAATVVTYSVATDRSFGVSSAWDRVLHWRTERRVERLNNEFADDRVFAEALAAATVEQFGTRPAVPPPGNGVPGNASGGGPPAVARARPANPRPVPVIAQAALLLSILLGGLLASVTAGRFKFRFDMGDGFRQVVTDRPIAMVGVLFIGGVLVGFGTRMAGGCSSGHGLSGFGRLHPVSILATAVFFGTAVFVSFLLWRVF